LISFHDKHSVNIVCKEALVASASKIQGHTPTPGPVPKGFRGMCCVCRLEEGVHTILQKGKEIDRASKYPENIT
jgi:hypothetical protein